MATNEELVAEIQSGQRERWVELWRQMQGLAWKCIRRWSWAKEKTGVENEDLLQASMIALLAAADSYDAARGAQFSTWYVMALKGEFTRAAGIRTAKQSQDPLRDATSLDAPLMDDEGDSLTLADTLEAPEAEEPFRQVELRVSLRKALAELPADQRRAIINRYWLEIPADPRAHDAALRALRHPSKLRALRGLL